MNLFEYLNTVKPYYYLYFKLYLIQESIWNTCTRHRNLIMLFHFCHGICANQSFELEGLSKSYPPNWIKVLSFTLSIIDLYIHVTHLLIYSFIYHLSISKTAYPQEIQPDDADFVQKQT